MINNMVYDMDLARDLGHEEESAVHLAMRRFQAMRYENRYKN